MRASARSARSWALLWLSRMKAMVSSMFTLLVVYQRSSHLYWSQRCAIAIDATPLLMRSSGREELRLLLDPKPAATGRSRGPFPHFRFSARLPELNHEASGMGYWETRARMAFVFASNYFRVPILNLAALGLDVFHMSNIFVRQSSHQHAAHRHPARHDLLGRARISHAGERGRIEAFRRTRGAACRRADRGIGVDAERRRAPARSQSRSRRSHPFRRGRRVLSGHRSRCYGGPRAAQTGASLCAVCRDHRAAQESRHAAGCLAAAFAIAARANTN